MPGFRPGCPEPIRTELEFDPAEYPIGLQRQPVDSLAQHGPGPARPVLPLHDTVGDDAQFVGVELDTGCDAAGEDPFAIVLIDQVLLAVTLGQRTDELGDQVGGCDACGLRQR